MLRGPDSLDSRRLLKLSFVPLHVAQASKLCALRIFGPCLYISEVDVIYPRINDTHINHRRKRPKTRFYQRHDGAELCGAPEGR